MKSFPYQYIPLFNFFLGIAIWLLDAAIDTYFISDETGIIQNGHHESKESYLDSLLFSEGTELWMRLLVIIVLVSVGFYARKIIHRQKLVENELLQHKHNLEDMIEERISEINEKNIELQNEVENRKLAEKELERLATTDPLTSLYNRRKTQQLLKDEIERAKRYHNPLSVIVIDIDHFKSINDLHGHARGDEVLVSFAQILLASVRSTDIVSRWGGEEFLIICPSCTATMTSLMTEKLRQQVIQHDFKGLNGLTFSAGIAEYRNDKSPVDFINRADKALYSAKSTGRNRITMAS